MERIVLRHLSGSKANQVEEFPLSHFNELIFGRDSSATVKYDPDRDDLVGRQHAKLIRDSSDPTRFSLTDLNSRNGTFINKQRITGTAQINPGDVIQFGPGGPEFQFDLEPRPQSTSKATRLATVPAGLAETLPPPTRVPEARNGLSTAPPMPPSSSIPPPVAPSGSVGKATVERMITQTKKSQTNKFLIIGGVVLVVVFFMFVAVVGFFVWRSRSNRDEMAKTIGDVNKKIDANKASVGLTTTEIVKNTGKAVVKIEASWKLISPNGGLVYHQYLPNRRQDGSPLIPNAPDYIPFYVKTVDGNIEPYLSYDGNAYSVAIGGSHSGSGFVVSSDGFILTNRHVAAAWKTAYDFPSSANTGIVFGPDKRTIVGTISQAPNNWVPGNTRQEIGGSFEGRNDRLDIVFPNTDGRIAGHLIRPSERHDVAMIKISIPDSAPKVEIFDNYDSIQPGDSVTVLGYPAISPPVFGIVKSQDVFNREAQVKEIPDPTVSVGNIGRILRSRESSSSKDEAVSLFGDAYQLTINSTGAGNSGGPVFDNQGRVIGIFYASRRGDAQITFAVPIRYGKELMSVGGSSK
jgi:serine protease Do